MHFEVTLILELALLGLVTGFLAGMLGIGGGMIMVPFVTAILTARAVAAPLAIKMAIATSMATIVFTSISSVRAHHKRKAVRWDIVKGLAPGIVLGAALASLGVFSVLKGSSLALLFALFVGFSATQMFLDKKPAPSQQLPGIGGLTGAGTLIGFLSGLVGAGGGSQCSGNVSGAGFSDCLGQRARLCLWWRWPGESAALFSGLCLAARAGGDCQLQRADRAAGCPFCAPTAGEKAQTRLCPDFVPAGRLHAVPGADGLSWLLNAAQASSLS